MHFLTILAFAGAVSAAAVDSKKEKEHKKKPDLPANVSSYSGHVYTRWVKDSKGRWSPPPGAPGTFSTNSHGEWQGQAVDTRSALFYVTAPNGKVYDVPAPQTSALPTEPMPTFDFVESKSKSKRNMAATPTPMPAEYDYVIGTQEPTAAITPTSVPTSLETLFRSITSEIAAGHHSEHEAAPAYEE